MNFLSPVFFLFFPAVFAAVHLTPAKHRYLVLLAAGCLFYGWGRPQRLLLLLLPTLWTWAGGLVIDAGKSVEAAESSRGRKCSPAKEKRRRVSPVRLYAFFFITNLLFLVFFKYAGALTVTLGHPLSIVMPVGLSFYLFQSSAYLGDVYRKDLPAERNLLRYAAFVSFFPTLLSGPIQRARDLLPQLLSGADEGVTFESPFESPFEFQLSGFLLLLWGLFGRLVISARLSAVTSEVFTHTADYTGMYCLCAMLLMSLYIYVDFASYSDIAIGCARMLGYQIGANFRTPFLALSLKEFWNRWHISLNDWFIENVYIPLGGSRGGKLRKYRNILLVFLLSGAWHGSSWNFVLWGGLNGIAMIAEEQLASLFGRRDRAERRASPSCEMRASRSRLPDEHAARSNALRAGRAKADAGPPAAACAVRWLRRLLVFLTVSVNFVFFGSASVRSALFLLRRILSIRLADITGFMPTGLFGWDARAMRETAAALLLFLLVQYLRHKEGWLFRRFCRLPLPLRGLLPAMLLAATVFAACAGSVQTNAAFLYYRF